MGAGNAAGSGEARSLQEAGDRDSGDDTEITSLTQTGSAETARSQAESNHCVHGFLILKNQCNTDQRGQCRDGLAKLWTERTQHAQSAQSSPGSGTDDGHSSPSYGDQVLCGPCPGTKA